MCIACVMLGIAVLVGVLNTYPDKPARLKKLNYPFKFVSYYNFIKEQLKAKIHLFNKKLP